MKTIGSTTQSRMFESSRSSGSAIGPASRAGDRDKQKKDNLRVRNEANGDFTIRLTERRYREEESTKRAGAVGLAS